MANWLTLLSALILVVAPVLIDASGSFAFRIFNSDASRDRWASWMKVSLVLLALTLIIHPEVRMLILFADLIGFDLFFFLLAMQCQANGRLVMSLIVKPAYVWLCRLTSMPCFMPTMETARRKPTLLLHALPIVPMLSIVAIILGVGQVFFGLHL